MAAFSAAPGKFVWDPASADRPLAQACLEVRAGRHGSIREVLLDTHHDYYLRAHRTQILGALAAGSRIAEEWVAEDPGDPDALLLLARVAVARALRAGENGDPVARELAFAAWDSGIEAAKANDRDPTPWVCLLALARFRDEVVPGPEGVDAPGPWDLLSEVQRRFPWHREAFHRMLSMFFARNGGSHASMWEVARWASACAPSDADPRLLSLVAYAEHYRARAANTLEAGIAERQWTENMAKVTILNVYDRWFPAAAERKLVPTADFSLLAHALLMAGHESEAGRVLEAMRPFASSFPWSMHGEPAQQLTIAYERCGIRPP